MKRSIKIQISFIFTGILLSTLTLCILLNVVFLKSYYLANKKHSLTDAYKVLDNASLVNDIESALENPSVHDLMKSNEVSLLVSDKDRKVIISNSVDSSQLTEYLNGLFLSDNEKTISLQNNTYVSNSYKDPNTDIEYIEIWGLLSNGERFLMRAAVDSVDNNVSVAVKFLIYVGLFSTAIGVFLIVLYTEKLTNPILKLSQISSRMKNLDFEAKYDLKTNNEIDLLGANINELSDRLEITISDLKNANVSLLNDIRKKDEIESMRKEYTSNVSHEFKTPIALIQGYAEGLKEGITEDEESRDYYLDVIIDEANKMNLLVKELMSLSELEFCDGEPDYERFDITELIKNKILSMELMIRQKGITVEFPNENEPVYVWSDEFKIEEVIQNYLSNAIHYCSNEKIIRITIEELNYSVRIKVFNTGERIDDNQIQRIWDKFYKVDKARSRSYGGSGIGLSIVKAIMKSINMDYGVTNLQNGVEFYFDLPTK